MPKKYKSWGTYSEQTVRAVCHPGSNNVYQVVIREGVKKISVHRSEIPSLITALLTIGDLK